MPSDQLRLTLIQSNIIWENKDANLRQYERLLSTVEVKGHIVVLPEMFTTGFTMNPQPFAETMNGETVEWMRNIARQRLCVITGSVIIEEGGHFFNRMIWMQPDGKSATYDKRHLFGFAGEDSAYLAGDKRVIVSINGWKVCLSICYDLRFPVWARNVGETYDILLYVANWPEKRITAWNTLLKARSIENQCYVVGVNRVGIDGKGISYNGSSQVFDPLGNDLIKQEKVGTECIFQVHLFRELLNHTRSEFPFLKDADRFMIL
ncbi:MAG: amidohydrolase [Bacteroidetes bacterium]|nr:amidohydrolase [Bacteroidota bacterium]